LDRLFDVRHNSGLGRGKTEADFWYRPAKVEDGEPAGSGEYWLRKFVERLFIFRLSRSEAGCYVLLKEPKSRFCEAPFSVLIRKKK
jgi:hypothetical protein